MFIFMFLYSNNNIIIISIFFIFVSCLDLIDPIVDMGGPHLVGKLMGLVWEEPEEDEVILKLYTIYIILYIC